MLRPLLLAALILVPATAALADDCNPGFASLLPQIVRKEAIAAVDESYTLRLWSFCRGLELHDTGNAGGLIRTIAANPFLVEPIEDKDWSVEDVKFVRVGDGVIDLWLHRDP